MTECVSCVDIWILGVSPQVLMVECVSCVDTWILGVSPQVLEKWLSV